MQSSSSSFLACNSRLRSAIRRHHPPQRVALRWCCFRSCWTVCWAMWCGDVLVVFSSLPEGRLTGSSWHLRCHPRAQYAQTDLVSRRDWIRAVSLGCFVSLQSIHHHSVRLGTIWCQAAYADTTGRTHRSYMRSSLTSRSSPNHTGILVRCTCCTASTSLR